MLFNQQISPKGTYMVGWQQLGTGKLNARDLIQFPKTPLFINLRHDEYTDFDNSVTYD